jgi:hypothetical protein
MPERLKQIWSGFEGVTTRRLTGGGIENIIPPSHRAYDPSEGMPKETATQPSPADVAAAELRARLTAHTEKVDARARRRGRKADRDEIDFVDNDRNRRSQQDPVSDVLKGMAATEMRTMRPDADFGKFLAANAGRKLASVGKRKKFLGVF